MKQVVDKRKDVVFYMKMFPLKIHPKAYKHAQAIYCEKKNKSDSSAIALLEDAYARKELPEPSCKTDVIEKNIELGKTLGITGTPTLVFEDGRKTSGAMGYDKLIQLIEKTDKKK